MEDYESIGHIMKHEEIDFLWFGNAKENPCDMFQTKITSLLKTATEWVQRKARWFSKQCAAQLRRLTRIPWTGRR